MYRLYTLKYSQAGVFIWPGGDSSIAYNNRDEPVILLIKFIIPNAKK